jgi:hypothetical protein
VEVTRRNMAIVRPALATALGVTLAVPLGARDAAAQNPEIDSSLAAQSYVVPSPYGDPTVRRRRLTQTLGFAVHDIHGGSTPGDPQLSLVTRLRLDSDLGQWTAERNPGELDRYIPGLQQAPLDLMVAYVDARGYADGWLSARVGRQYLIDSLGWWSFDGGLLRIDTPAYLRLEAYGGYEQRAGLRWLSTSRYTADGVYRGPRYGLEDHEWPSYLEESRPAPAYGIALESSNLRWLHARIGYRKVINRDRVSVTHFPDAGGEVMTIDDERVSSERVGGSVSLTKAEWGAVSGNATYDFLNQLFSEHAAALSWYATRQITLGVEYDYYLPTFDGDSIFNWFSHHAMTTVQSRGSFQVTRRLALSATTGLRQFRTQGDPDEYADQSVAFGVVPETSDTVALATDALGTASVQYWWSTGSVSLTGMGQAGGSGHHLGADLLTTRQFYDGTYDSLLILSLHDWSDELRSDRDATSFAYVLGGGVRPLRRVRFGGEWEHALNRLVGHRFRVLATLDVAVLP